MLSTDIKKLIKEMPERKFEFKVICSESTGNYIVLFIDGNLFTRVSSKRKDNRIFKTLEAAQKCILEMGRNSFSVTYKNF